MPGGVKHDGGKPPISLIPRSAIEAEARVLAVGVAKYGKDNWRQGMSWSRLVDASLRHILAYADGEDLDSETGLSHLAHARASLSFLIEYADTHPELDDRTKATVKPKQTSLETMTAPVFYKWEWDNQPNCMEAAYERKAIEEGLVTAPVFDCNSPSHIK